MAFAPASVAEALAGQGRDLGASRWVRIEQPRINMFAEATGDHIWLHTDPARAANGPFGTTIAHGFLTLSLLNMFLPELFMPANQSWGVNYGVNRVRFPAPVPVGARLRCHATLAHVEEVAPDQIRSQVDMVVEVEGLSKPGCVAEMLQHYAFAPAPG